MGVALEFPKSIRHQASRSVMATSVRLLQLENAFSPIEVTLSGMLMPVRLVQESNAKLPIEITLSGMVILVRLGQS